MSVITDKWFQRRLKKLLLLILTVRSGSLVVPEEGATGIHQGRQDRLTSRYCSDWCVSGSS